MRRPPFFLSAHRAIFLIIVMATTLLWFAASMSEQRTYSTTFKVEWKGFDTLRYVVLSADTTVTFAVVSNGFNALVRNYKAKRHPLVLTASHDTLFMPNDLVMHLSDQFSFSGIRKVDVPQGIVHINLAEREHRRYAPIVRNLSVSFTAPYALYGTPRLTPDSVTLYGSRTSLDAITSLYTTPFSIANVTTSDDYEIPLEPVWEQYPDVRPSATTVKLSLPTQCFAEKTFDIPVALHGIDSSRHVRLYPDHVRVTLMVAQCDYAQIMSDMIAPYVTFDPSLERWKVSIDHFPANVRVKHIDPSEIQYVVILDK